MISPLYLFFVSHQLLTLSLLNTSLCFVVSCLGQVNYNWSIRAAGSKVNNYTTILLPPWQKKKKLHYDLRDPFHILTRYLFHGIMRYFIVFTWYQMIPSIFLVTTSETFHFTHINLIHWWMLINVNVQKHKTATNAKWLISVTMEISLWL